MVTNSRKNQARKASNQLEIVLVHRKAILIVNLQVTINQDVNRRSKSNSNGYGNHKVKENCDH